MYYDENIFQEFRAKAIINKEDLVIGKTYYSNHHGEFVLLACNEKQMITNCTTFMYYNDNNIGASYNPWLIFDNKETYDECIKRLIILWGDRVHDEFEDLDYISHFYKN